MAHQETEALVKPLVDFAQLMLKTKGGFNPFGVTMSSDGKINMVGAGDGSNVQEILGLLSASFKQQAGAKQIKAAGICLDTRIKQPTSSEKTDAIAVSIEHECGDAIDFCIPYRKKLFRGIVYSDRVTMEGTRKFFT